MDIECFLAMFVVFCLATTLVLTIPTRSDSTIIEYDPWADINDDGKIDMYDIGYVARLYGTFGILINKTDLLLQLEDRIAAVEARVGELHVVAAGFVLSNGDSRRVYNVQSTMWDPVERGYVISINGTYYLWLDYVTIVTCGAGSARFASTSSLRGDLLVFVYDADGNRVQDFFQFVTYQIP